MDTPATTYKLRHAPTPKMSQRKKSLFSSKPSDENTINEDSDLGPIEPLDFSSPVRLRYETDSEQSANGIAMNCVKENIPLSFKNILNILSPIKQNTQILNESNKMVTTSNLGLNESHKYTVLKTPSDSSIKTKSPKVSSRYTRSNSNPILTPTAIHVDSNELVRLKRNLDDNDTLSSQAPERKILKVDNEKSKARTSLSFTDVSISTKSFYASSKTPNTETLHRKKSLNKLFTTAMQRKQSRKPNLKYGTINKGVRHKIIKKKKSLKKKNGKIDLSNFSKQSLLKAATSLIENSKINDYLAKLTTAKEKLNKNDLSKEQLKRINNLLKSLRTSDMNTHVNTSNEDDDDDEVEDEEESDSMLVEQSVEIDENKTKNKFFKSGAIAKNVYKITDTISASVNKGKICLNKPKVRKQLKIKSKTEKNFTSEKLEINNIIDKLYHEYSLNKKDVEMVDEVIKEIGEAGCSSNNVQIEIDQDVRQQEKGFNETETNKFFKMLPYNTSDPELIERQQNVLTFLIMNNICTEENFNIFIIEADLHKDKANKIIDDLIEVEISSDRPQESVHDNDKRLDLDGPLSPTSQISNMTSELAIDHGKDKDESEGKYYKIFTSGSHKEQSDLCLRKPGTSKKNWRLIGDNQYQIDAGQKEFGAKTCTECGLIYTVHVPEDELIHINFHSKANVLKFKGWTNEQIIKTIDEWGVRGRIIVIPANDTKIKLKKVNDLFDLLGNEMGNTNVELKDNSMVYLALNQSQIMGVCVAEPLKDAHRIQKINNLHFYSKELYPVKCGISRIWISPLHRRKGVAKQLVAAIQAHFIYGINISFDEIAFSSPTELGQSFAENLTQRQDFLIY